jgi:hypothetical protein
LPLPPYTTAGVWVMVRGITWQVMDVNTCGRGDWIGQAYAGWLSLG